MGAKKEKEGKKTRRKWETMKDTVVFIGTDEQILEVLRELPIADYEYVTFQEAAEGLVYLENNSEPLDLIIVGGEEITENNYEMLKKIRGHYLYENIPLLVGVSAGQTEKIGSILDMGADDLLIRPINHDVARKRIQTMIDFGRKKRIHNVMEDLIRTQIDENIDSLGICPCINCRNDLLTLTLNHVKPKYVNTEKGNAIIKAGTLASMEDRIHLLADITHYAKIIGENPRHE